MILDDDPLPAPPSEYGPYHTCWNFFLNLKHKYCSSLECWNDRAPRIKFLQVLGNGGQAAILKVQIDSKIYVLKLYHFLRPVCPRSKFKLFATTTDPFFVECQAYDLLIKANLNGLVGPFCHGWLTIDKCQERKVNKMLRGSFSWNRRQDTALEPIHGILLEYLDDCNLDKASPPVDAQGLRDKLAHLHSLDIAHGDFKASNIMVSNGQGYLIDFGASKLCPNRYLSRKDLEEWKQDEVNSLEYYLFRLQSLKRFQGIQLTPATTAEEAYDGELNEWKEREFPKQLE